MNTDVMLEKGSVYNGHRDECAGWLKMFEMLLASWNDYVKRPANGTSEGSIRASQSALPRKRTFSKNWRNY